MEEIIGQSQLQGRNKQVYVFFRTYRRPVDIAVSLMESFQTGVYAIYGESEGYVRVEDVFVSQTDVATDAGNSRPIVRL